MFFVSDYGIVSLQHIVFAGPVNPCPDHEHEDTGHGHNQEFLIELTLLVGQQRSYEKIVFPSRGVRDVAFEEFVALMRRFVAECYDAGEEVSGGDDD